MAARSEPGFIPDNISAISHSSHARIVNPPTQSSQNLIDQMTKREQRPLFRKAESQHASIEQISRQSEKRSERYEAKREENMKSEEVQIRDPTGNYEPRYQKQEDLVSLKSQRSIKSSIKSGKGQESYKKIGDNEFEDRIEALNSQTNHEFGLIGAHEQSKGSSVEIRHSLRQIRQSRASGHNRQQQPKQSQLEVSKSELKRGEYGQSQNRAQLSRKPSRKQFIEAQDEPYPYLSQADEQQRKLYYADVQDPKMGFETDYSENLRDNKIIEHHYESNHTVELSQMRQIEQLMKILILTEECKLTKRKIKTLQMENRRHKIELRTGSYSKKFNFHSPIERNNRQSLEFRKQFKVSPNLKEEWMAMKAQIKTEKDTQVRLEEQLRVFSEFYQLMKDNKVGSYPVKLHEFGYYGVSQNSPRTKRGKDNSSSINELLFEMGERKRYEFDPSNRHLQVDSGDVSYHQLLNYKKEISKDAILEAEVFTMGKIKKLKDQNRVLKKQLQIINAEILNVDKKLLMGSGGSGFGSSPNKTARPISSSRSKGRMNFSRSPQSFRRITESRQLTYSRDSSATKNKLESGKKIVKRHTLASPSNEYGLEPTLKTVIEIPTFGRKQGNELVRHVNERSSSAKRINLVRRNTNQIHSQTNLNSPARSINASRRKLGKMSQKVSPKRESIASEYYLSSDRSNG